MQLLDLFEKDGVIDRYIVVFDEQNPGGYRTMLAMSEDGHTFSQWTSGLYEPGGANEHLGRRIRLRDLGRTALDGLFARLSTPEEWEQVWRITHGADE